MSNESILSYGSIAIQARSLYWMPSAHHLSAHVGTDIHFMAASPRVIISIVELQLIHIHEYAGLA